MVNIKKNDNFIISSQGDMGFELTASIGSQIAEPNKMVIPIFGEGSLQLNIQELQTIVHHKLPIKMLIFNNNSYGANFITQNLYFKILFGTNPESGLSFPNTEKIASAYGIKYMSVKTNDQLDDVFTSFLNTTEPVICEVFCSIQQRTPKLSSVKNDDGTFSSRPYEDMEPFLSRDEFASEMIVKLI
jgi:acetolactate synthase-1/2/3 large subunit